MTLRNAIRLTIPLAIGVLARASCSGGEASDGNTFYYPSWRWEEGDVGKWHDERLAEFEASHEDITVQPTQIAAGDFENQINTQISAGQAPDLMSAFTNMMPALIENDLLAPLDECLADTDIMDRLLPSVEFAQRDGQTYGVPLTMSPQGLIYNAEIMEEAGVEEVPTTPEEL